MTIMETEEKNALKNKRAENTVKLKLLLQLQTADKSNTTRNHLVCFHMAPRQLEATPDHPDKPRQNKHVARDRAVT